jgi:uncharacterized membrane protein
MKLHLCAATALVSVMMLTGTAGAEPAPSKSPALPAATAEQQKPVQSDKPRLSDEKNQTLKAAMAKARADNKQINDQIKAKRKELAALMKAEKFDKAAFLAKNAEMQELMAKASRARTEALATVAEKFSAQDRKILAERFEKGKKGRTGHGMNKASGETGR